MGKLSHLSADQLKTALADADGVKATKRLVVSLDYKNGVGVDVISERYGIPQSTIYYWLDRFADKPLEEALRDESRPGRPPKLSDEQRAEVESWLKESPQSFDYDADTWTAELLRAQIVDEFDVEYSVPHIHRTFLD
jgi:transposase